MKFFVVGASGFVGSHMVQTLKDAGHEVLGTRTGPSAGDTVSFDLSRQRITDVLPEKFHQPGNRFFAIVAAVRSDIDYCARNPEVTRRVNVDGTLRLIADVKQLGGTVVYLSSSWVFDGKSGGYTETSFHNPINEYGRQKSIVEKSLHDRLDETLILRLDKIVGADPRERHLFSEWKAWVDRDQPIVCIKDQEFSPTLVDDVARAAERLCCSGATGLFNVANPEVVTREALAHTFLRSIDRSVPVTTKRESEIGLLEPRPQRSFLDSRKFLSTTEFRFTPMADALKRFAQAAG